MPIPDKGQSDNWEYWPVLGIFLLCLASGNPGQLLDIRGKPGKHPAQTVRESLETAGKLERIKVASARVKPATLA